MTSDNISVTRCEVCPGHGLCFRERTSSLRNAYAKGCRLPEACTANTIYIREQRAKRRASERAESAVPAGEWAELDAVPAREPTSETCSVCGSAMHWERTRAGQSCVNGHWSHAPGTVDRIPRKEQTEKQPIDKRADIMERMRANVRKQKLVDNCDILLAWVNPDNYQSNTWHRQYAVQASREFKAIRQEILNADSPADIAIIETILTEAIGTFQGYKIQLQTELTRLANMQTNTHALTRAPESYDDDESDDESDNDESDNSIIGAPDNPYVSLASSIVAATRQAREQKDHERERCQQYGECEFKGWHTIFSGGPVTRWVTGNNTGLTGHQTYGAPVIYICNSRKCLARADKYFINCGYQDCTYGELS